MFDTSTRQSCRVRASATSTPLHALTTLNDPTWMEAARVLAEHALHSSPKVEDAIDFSYKRILARSPKATEQQILKQAFEKQLVLYRENAEEANKLLTVGAAPRDTTLDPSTHAALSAVCLAIFNLDEALCRQ
jgi:hypothetical protein